jgi:hypothetical protein
MPALSSSETLGDHPVLLFFCDARERKIEAEIARVRKRCRCLWRRVPRRKAAVLAVLHIFAIGLEHGRVCPGLGKNFSQHRQVETESGAEAQTFREPSSVDVLEAVLRYELEQIYKTEILRRLKQRFGGKPSATSASALAEDFCVC